MAVHRCRVCYGRGTVPAGFYDDVQTTTTAAPMSVECRACHGRGIVYDYAGSAVQSPWVYPSYPLQWPQDGTWRPPSGRFTTWVSSGSGDSATENITVRSTSTVLPEDA